MTTKTKKPLPVLIGVDFSDMDHGLGVLLEYQDADQAEHRQHVATMLVNDLAKMPRGSALDAFVTALQPVVLFGDHPTPNIRELFNAMVLSCSGYSAGMMIAKTQRDQAIAHGKKGGKKLDTYDIRELDERDEDVYETFLMYRSRRPSDRNARQAMVDANFEDLNGDRLPIETIKTIVRRVKLKKQQ